MIRENISRRQALETIGAAGLSMLAGCSGETEGYPSDTITIVIPYGAGGGFDTHARIMADHLPDHLPNEVDVQGVNVEGSGGVVAVEQVYNTDPDGYEFMIAHPTSFILSQIGEDVNYDLQEMTWFSQTGHSQIALFAADHTDIHEWDDFVEGINNEEIAYSAVGLRETNMMATAAAGEATGQYSARNLLGNVVNHDGSSGAFQSLLRGDTDVRTSSFDAAVEHLENGDLRLVTHVSPNPTQFGDEYPADDLQDLGIYDEAAGAFGMAETRRAYAGPPDMPDDVESTLGEALDSAAASDEVKSDIEEAGRTYVYADRDEVREMVDNAFDTADIFTNTLEIAQEELES